MKAIQKELGESDDSTQEIDELRKKVEDSGMPAEAKKECERELKRLAKMTPASAEYMVSRTYLEWMTSLPWSKSSGTAEIDIAKARDILDEDHYDLQKVKERILDYLAVKKLQPGMKGPILCFVGPPGVGKTSLGRSIARSLGRKFARISLGGMHDEAEIRGHRRTYIGALPGQIIQGLRRAETNDPVFMLDEVDKLGRDFRGDPASALLETLDPEQNSTFRDNYLDVPFDLSKVLFICTANQLDPVPEPLRDRMELTKRPGVSVGLAWTPAGGDVLFIEANRMKGKGSFTMTGQIGQVMQESMQAALTWVRSNAKLLGLDEDFLKESDIHIHVPAGAIPKDGPSAGVTMATALASLMTGKQVRPLLAMTGEITLSGNVLPVGGIKEKVLSAKRAGVHDVVLPAENRQNLEDDITPEQLEGLTVHYATSIGEVLDLALPHDELEKKQNEVEREQVLQNVG